MKIWEETIEYHKNKIHEANEELERICKLIVDANDKGGIEESCKIQDLFGPKIDILIETKKYHEKIIRLLSGD